MGLSVAMLVSVQMMSFFTASGTNSSAAADCAGVTTPTATETMLPWKRDDEWESTFSLKQSEFPAWCSNKEYLAYSSPSATFLGNLLFLLCYRPVAHGFPFTGIVSLACGHLIGFI
jgi:hypothetical protein